MKHRLPTLRAAFLLACAALPLAACGGTVPPNAPATSTGPNSNREPQTANSLPPGFQTPHPLLPATGLVGTAAVGL